MRQTQRAVQIERLNAKDLTTNVVLWVPTLPRRIFAGLGGCRPLNIASTLRQEKRQAGIQGMEEADTARETSRSAREHRQERAKQRMNGIWMLVSKCSASGQSPPADAVGWLQGNSETRQYPKKSSRGVNFARAQRCASASAQLRGYV